MRVEVRVRLGSGKPEFKDEILTVHTTEKLEKGLANRDVIQQIAKFYNVSSSEIRIVTGLKSRRKIIEINAAPD